MTTILSAHGLADLFNRTVEQADKPEIRIHDLGDREIYGQLVLLEQLAGFCYLGWLNLTDEEDAAIERARNAADEARRRLADAIKAAAEAEPQPAAT